MARFLVTIEVKSAPDDPLPDIGTECVEYESLEVAIRRVNKVAELQNAEYAASGLSERGRVVSVEPVVERPMRRDWRP